MVRETLVKLLSEKDIDVNDLSESNISEYLQARETKKKLKTFFIDPFEGEVKKNIGVFYHSDLGSVESREVKKNITYSPKEICSLIDSNILMQLTQNNSNQRLDGVKRYRGQITLDPIHSSNLIDLWKSQVIGENVDKGISVKISDLEKVVSIHTPRLITENSFLVPKDFNESEVGLYLSAREQSKKLQKLIISPFEAAFKRGVNSNGDETNLDLKHYGNLSVAVKCVPRYEPNYQRVLDFTKSFLDMVARMSPIQEDLSRFFFNNERLNPRMYVSANYFLSQINNVKMEKDLKVKKELSILYKPQGAYILVD